MNTVNNAPSTGEPLSEVKQVTKTGEGGRGSQVEILNSTYGGNSPTNSRLCIEHLKDEDIP